MATGAARGILRIPGKLCINPTDLTTAFPHGGTALGLTRQNAFRPNVRSSQVAAEEFGQVTVEQVYQGETPRFAAFIRQWDTDAITTIFPTATTGSPSGQAVIAPDVDGTVRSGKLLAAGAHVLCVSPRDLDTKPMLVFYRAVVLPQESNEMQFSPSDEFGLAAVWEALPDSTGRLYAMALREDITL